MILEVKERKGNSTVIFAETRTSVNLVNSVILFIYKRGKNSLQMRSLISKCIKINVKR